MNKQPQILVIDDEPISCDTLEAFLHPENYHLVFATNGFEALDRLQSFEPDVILLDVMMPGMNGYEVCQRIKTHKPWQHIPIVLVTALNSKAEVIRGLDAGADEFLSKPVNGFELRARVRSMLRIKQQYDQLAATLKLREDLARMIVHDMRGPLTLILALSELLLEEATVPPHLVQNITQTSQQAKRLQAFTDDLLTIAKVENDQLILNRSMVDINRLLLELQQSYQVIAQSKGINFVLETSFTGQRSVEFDYNLFYRVLDNLLTNAFKFSQTASTITIQVEYPDPQNSLQTPASAVRIKIIDEGLGIPVEYRERIFDKFEVIAAPEQHISQIGLGLAFCKLVVEAHGGRIWVEANEPHGSIFVVEV